jgi:hypothetical protein
VLTSWDEVVTEFYRAPARWWWKCMSQMGNDNQLSQLKQSMFIEDNATGGVTQVRLGLSSGLPWKLVAWQPSCLCMLFGTDSIVHRRFGVWT